MVGPQSYLVDSSIPACEEILLPVAIRESGHHQFDVIEQQELSDPAGLRRVRRFLNKVNRVFNLSKIDNVSNELVLDFRVNSPSNWAHAITNHLPLALYVRLILMKHHKEKILIVLIDQLLNASLNAPMFLLGGALLGRTKEIYLKNKVVNKKIIEN